VSLIWTHTSHRPLVHMSLLGLVTLLRLDHVALEFKAVFGSTLVASLTIIPHSKLRITRLVEEYKAQFTWRQQRLGQCIGRSVHVVPVPVPDYILASQSN
jgi:hypothetical protein